MPVLHLLSSSDSLRACSHIESFLFSHAVCLSILSTGCGACHQFPLRANSRETHPPLYALPCIEAIAPWPLALLIRFGTGPRRHRATPAPEEWPHAGQIPGGAASQVLQLFCSADPRCSH